MAGRSAHDRGVEGWGWWVTGRLKPAGYGLCYCNDPQTRGLRTVDSGLSDKARQKSAKLHEQGSRGHWAQVKDNWPQESPVTHTFKTHHWLMIRLPICMSYGPSYAPQPPHPKK